MPVTPNQIYGGSFQDILGDPVVLGHMVLTLTLDESVNTSSEVCSGISVSIPLDANGSVLASPAQNVWPNDLLLPANSFYRVTVYSSKGQRMWGPNAQQIPSSPSPFDLGTWVPNQITES